MQIGRKIYYELATGNVILSTSEMQGSVIETTIDQDFQMFSALQPYQQSAVGVLQLAFGQDAINFAKYPYHVDTTTNTIVWDTANPIGASLQDVQNSKIAQLNDMYKQTLTNGFQATVGGTEFTFGWTTDDKSNILLTQQGIDDGFITFPFYYADVVGHPVTITSQDDFNIIKARAASFFNAQHQQILNLIGQVKIATDVNVVSAIQWVAVSYA